MIKTVIFANKTQISLKELREQLIIAERLIEQRVVKITSNTATMTATGESLHTATWNNAYQGIIGPFPSTSPVNYSTRVSYGGVASRIYNGLTNANDGATTYYGYNNGGSSHSYHGYSNGGKTRINGGKSYDRNRNYNKTSSCNSSSNTYNKASGVVIECQFPGQESLRIEKTKVVKPASHKEKIVEGASVPCSELDTVLTAEAVQDEKMDCNGPEIGNMEVVDQSQKVYVFNSAAAMEVLDMGSQVYTEKDITESPMSTFESSSSHSKVQVKPPMNLHKSNDATVETLKSDISRNESKEGPSVHSLVKPKLNQASYSNSCRDDFDKSKSDFGLAIIRFILALLDHCPWKIKHIPPG